MSGQKWISTTVKYRQTSIEEQRELMNKWFPLGQKAENSTIFRVFITIVMGRKNGIDIEIDKLTNSIVNAVTSEVFETEFAKVTSRK